MNPRIWTRVLTLFPAFLLPTLAAGQCDPALVETFMPIGGQFDEFGRAVAIHGDVAVIGAPNNDEAGSNAGALYVFRLDGGAWNLEQKLLASDPEQSEQLGKSVAIAGGVIAAGAPGFDQQRGAVCVFRYSGGVWKQEVRLVPPQLEVQSWFGASVAIHADENGEVVAGGAPAGPGGSGVGAVHVYRRAGGPWEWEGKFTPAEVQEHDVFGCAVALNGERFVAGAYAHETYRGAAYVFAHSGNSWAEEAKLQADDAFVGQYLGVDVDIDADTVVVGSWAYDNGCDCPLPGSAYVFREDAGAWVQEAKLVPADGMDEEFGMRVALEGNVAVVGSLQDISAYIYARKPGGWEQQAKLDLPGMDTIRDMDLNARRALFGGEVTQSGPALLYQLCDAGCYADADGDGDLTLFDFLAFVNLFNAGDAYADCDANGDLDLFDFLCFVNAFNAGCE